MSEEKNRRPRQDYMNPIDLIKRTIGDRCVSILPFFQDNKVKFEAKIQNGPTVILQYGNDGWVGTHPDDELVEQLGILIEDASE
jgi:hypothetical protein